MRPPPTRLRRNKALLVETRHCDRIATCESAMFFGSGFMEFSHNLSHLS